MTVLCMEDAKPLPHALVSYLNSFRFFLKYSCHDLYNIESLWPHCLAVEFQFRKQDSYLIGRRDGDTHNKVS